MIHSRHLGILRSLAIAPSLMLGAAPALCAAVDLPDTWYPLPGQLDTLTPTSWLYPSPPPTLAAEASYLGDSTPRQPQCHRLIPTSPTEIAGAAYSIGIQDITAEYLMARLPANAGYGILLNAALHYREPVSYILSGPQPPISLLNVIAFPTAKIFSMPIAPGDGPAWTVAFPAQSLPGSPNSYVIFLQVETGSYYTLPAGSPDQQFNDIVQNAYYIQLHCIDLNVCESAYPQVIAQLQSAGG